MKYLFSQEQVNELSVIRDRLLRNAHSQKDDAGFTENLEIVLELTKIIKDILKSPKAGSNSDLDRFGECLTLEEFCVFGLKFSGDPDGDRFLIATNTVEMLDPSKLPSSKILKTIDPDSVHLLEIEEDYIKSELMPPDSTKLTSSAIWQVDVYSQKQLEQVQRAFKEYLLPYSSSDS